MGSSAQNSSGVHWCRRRVRFNEVPEEGFRRLPKKGSERLWCRAPGHVQQGSGKGSGEGVGGLVQGQVRFSRVPENSRKPSWGVSSDFAARFRKICKNKTMWAVGWAHILDLTRCTCRVPCAWARCTRLESISFRRFVVSSFQSYAAGTCEALEASKRRLSSAGATWSVPKASKTQLEKKNSFKEF